MSAAFDNSYARLPDDFHSRECPVPVAHPALVVLNGPLAEAIGIDPAEFDHEVLAGNRIPEGADPIALAYAGHQFGHFVPQLGDGRAILLGEVVGPDGKRRDIQLKGSGRTAFSRDGDGRAAIGPAIREYVVSEAMAALGIPTTRSLAVVSTGEQIVRERLLPGAVLTRVARSHIRVGTFQYHFARGDLDSVRLLTDHVITRHYPEAADAGVPELALLQLILDRQAALVARWMHVGFIHGVMNTDNTSIAGETIDYGPCAFLDNYHPGKVFSSIDRHGRYSWGNQPRIAHWNLSRLAQTLIPLVPGDPNAIAETARAILATFPDSFTQAYTSGFARKLGLLTEGPRDLALVQDLLELLAREEVDFTLFFRHLTASLASGDDAELRALFKNPDRLAPWHATWRERMAEEDRDLEARLAVMRAANPIFIPRNHRLEEVIAAANLADYVPLEKLLSVLARPFEEQPENSAYEKPPAPEEVVHATFCGT